MGNERIAVFTVVFVVRAIVQLDRGRDPTRLRVHQDKVEMFGLNLSEGRAARSWARNHVGQADFRCDTEASADSR